MQHSGGCTLHSSICDSRQVDISTPHDASLRGRYLCRCQNTKPYTQVFSEQLVPSVPRGLPALPTVSVGRMILESSHFPSPATPHALFAALRFLPVSGARVSDVSLNKVRRSRCAAG